MSKASQYKAAVDQTDDSVYQAALRANGGPGAPTNSSVVLKWDDGSTYSDVITMSRVVTVDPPEPLTPPVVPPNGAV